MKTEKEEEKIQKKKKKKKEPQEPHSNNKLNMKRKEFQKICGSKMRRNSRNTHSGQIYVRKIKSFFATKQVNHSVHDFGVSTHKIDTFFLSLFGLLSIFASFASFRHGFLFLLDVNPLYVNSRAAVVGRRITLTKGLKLKPLMSLGQEKERK